MKYFGIKLWFSSEITNIFMLKLPSNYMSSFSKIFLNLLNLKICTVHDFSLWDKNLLSYLEHTRQFKGSTKKAPLNNFSRFRIMTTAICFFVNMIQRRRKTYNQAHKMRF